MKKVNRFFVLTLLLCLLPTSLLLAQQRSELFVTNTLPSQTAAYIFEVNFDSELEQTSHFDIIFPPEFNIRNAVMATSSKMDGSLSVSVSNDTLSLSRTSAESVVPAGEFVDFKIATILNPTEISPEYTFTVILKQQQSEVERKQIISALNPYERNNR